MLRATPLALVLACAGGTSSPGPSPTGDASETTGVTADTRPTDTGIHAVGPVLVVPHSSGITFVGLDGTIVSAPTWRQLLGTCDGCTGEGASPDGDGVLVSVLTGTGGPGDRRGLAARVALDGTLDFRIDGLGFPHDAIRDPADDTLLVVETSANRLTWLPGDGTSTIPLRTLSSLSEEFPRTPNGAERLDHGGRTYVVVSHRPREGRITMWDITDPEAPAFVWRFPAAGYIDTPHGPILREVNAEWWLLWAHTGGLGTNNGTVGLAVAASPTDPPVYVADLTPSKQTGAFQFLRGVELTPDLRLFATDSGMGPAGQGRVVEAAWPDLTPPGTGETGAIGSQRLVDLGDTSAVLDGVRSPFEGWLWDRAIQP